MDDVGSVSLGGTPLPELAVPKAPERWTAWFLMLSLRVLIVSFLVWRCKGKNSCGIGQISGIFCTNLWRMTVFIKPPHSMKQFSAPLWGYILNVTMLQCYKVTKWKSATSCGEIADVEWLTSFCSECYRAVAHARGSSEGSQGCREDADDDLQDGLPSLFLHGVDGLRD